MAEPTELRLDLPVDRARSVVASALTEQGFDVSATPSGVLQVQRGSLGKTIAFGAMAGDNMHVTFDVRVESAGTGAVVVVDHSALGGFFKGGAIGASKLGDVVQNAVHQLGTSLAAQGVLAGQVPVAAPSEDATDSASPSTEGAPASTASVAQVAPAAVAPGGFVPPPVDYVNRTNIVAIFAVILGFIVPVGGVVAGIVALGQVKRTGEKGRGLAISGIAVGSALTVLYVVAIFAATVLFAANVAGGTGAGVPFSQSEQPDYTDPGAGGGEVALSAVPRVGECIDETASGLVFPSCADAHDYEVFSTFALEGDTYPGDKAVAAEADARCGSDFETFTGLPYADSTLEYSHITPDASAWSQGDTGAVCVVYDPAGKTTGTLAGSAR